MKKIFLVFILLFTTATAHAQTYTVERVIDGNTIVVTTPEGKSERVRLIGIDTPESKPNDKAKRDSKRTGQDFKTVTKMGKEATKFLKSILKYSSTKEVELKFDTQERDKYGQLLAYVYIVDRENSYSRVRDDLVAYGGMGGEDGVIPLKQRFLLMLA